jgi:hypothetical protein
LIGKVNLLDTTFTEEYGESNHLKWEDDGNSNLSKPFKLSSRLYYPNSVTTSPLRDTSFMKKESV